MNKPATQRDYLNDYEPILPPEIPAAQHAAVKAAVLGMRTTPGTTVRDVARVFTPFVDDKRALTLAITELTRAAAAATNAQQRQLRTQGISMIRFWSSSNDAYVCDVCAGFHNQPESVWGQQFPKGPPAHEGCRCDIFLKLDRSATPTPNPKPAGLVGCLRRVLGLRSGE